MFLLAVGGVFLALLVLLVLWFSGYIVLPWEQGKRG